MPVVYGKMECIMMSNSEPSTFWQDKRVIVTGGAGFLGSFVIEKLKERGVRAERIFIPRIENYNLDLMYALPGQSVRPVRPADYA